MVNFLSCIVNFFTDNFGPICFAVGVGCFSFDDIAFDLRFCFFTIFCVRLLFYSGGATESLDLDVFVSFRY